MVSGFDENEAKRIKEAKTLLEKESVKSDLAFIKCHLSFLPLAITRLEESGLTLISSVSILHEVKEKINSIPGTKGKIFQEKLQQVLRKNSNLEVIQHVARVQSGDSDSLPVGWMPDEVAELKFCPMTSVDVERSFSIYKHIFSDRRHNFKEENLEKVMVCNCFYARQE